MEMKGEKADRLKTGWFASIWRRKFLIVFLALLVAVTVAVLSVRSELSQAVGYIKLDFESAHDGLAPNGTRFNIYDMKDEAILTRAIEITGLAGKITWRELANCLSIAPSRTQSVSKRYIATEYTATLVSHEAFGTINARSMLDVIYRLYYEEFLRQSGVNHAPLSVDWSVLEDMEYLEAVEFIKTRTDIMRQFLLNRITESGGYESAETGSSFRALLTTVENFQSVYIDKYTALLTQSHLFANPDDYRAKLTYQRMLVDQNYQLSRAQFSTREKALDDYEESLIAIVMVPTYYQGNGLYMSRTQTGIDILTKEAESYSAVSQKQALKLSQIDGALESLDHARSAAPGWIEALLSNITGQFDMLSEKVRLADDAYVSYAARDYVSFIPRVVGLVSAYGLKFALLCAFGAALCLGALFILIDARKRSRIAGRAGKGVWA